VQRDAPRVFPDLQSRHAILACLNEGRLERQGASSRAGKHRRKSRLGEGVHLRHRAQTARHRRNVDAGPLAQECAISATDRVYVQVGLWAQAECRQVAPFERFDKIAGHGASMSAWRQVNG
jgi:hypothetical protein